MKVGTPNSELIIPNFLRILRIKLYSIKKEIVLYQHM